LSLGQHVHTARHRFRRSRTSASPYRLEAANVTVDLIMRIVKRLILLLAAQWRGTLLLIV
jgi:hypothetical protein